MRWFISDLHLGDESLLRRRYSKTVDQMDAHLAARWDAKVGAGDEVWVLGDVARGRTQEYLRDWFEARPGTKHLVLGNWDIGAVETSWEDVGFSTVSNRANLPLSNGTRVSLSHYPYGHRLNVDGDFTLLHGHTHSPKKVRRGPEGQLMIHVGWDAWRRMVPESEIVRLIEEE